MPSRAIRSAEVREKIRNYIAVGIASIIILVITIITAGREQNLRCERQEHEIINCTIWQSIMGVIKLSQKSFPGVGAVSIGQQCQGLSCKYRLEMYTTQGQIPVNEKYTSNYEQQVQIKEKLNKFFIDKTSSFVEMKEQTNPVLMVAVFAVFIVVWSYLGYLIAQARNPSPSKGDALG